MRNELEIGRWNMTWTGLNGDVVLSDAFLAGIGAPVYLLWGENDPFGPPEVARRFAQKLPNATLELMAEAGHAVWIDDPDHVAVAMKRFFSRSESTSDGAERADAP